MSPSFSPAKKIIASFSFLLAACLTLLLTACPKKQSESRKVLQVACELSFPPYAYQDMTTDAVMGADIDLIRELGERIGYDVHVIPTNFSQIIPALEAGKIDVGISSISVTDERKERVLFTDPYDKITYQLVLPKSSKIKSMEDIQTQRVAVKESSSQLALVEKKCPHAHITTFFSDYQALSALASRKADVAVVNSHRAAIFTDRLPEYIRVNAHVAAEDIAIAVSKDNAMLCEKLNNELKILAEGGFYAKALKKHREALFSMTPTDMVEPLIVCAATTFPPFVFQSGDKLVGVDLELAKKVAQQLERPIVFRQVPTSKIVDTIASGKADIGISGLSATEERKGQVIFSESYHEGGRVILVRTESDINYLEDIENVSVGVVQGTASEEFVRGFDKMPKALTLYKNSIAMAEALIQGKIDAAIDESVTASVLCDQNIGKIRYIDGISEREDYVFLIDPKKTELKKTIDEVLRTAKLNGELDKLFRKYELQYVTTAKDMVTF